MSSIKFGLFTQSLLYVQQLRHERTMILVCGRPRLALTVVAGFSRLGYDQIAVGHIPVVSVDLLVFLSGPFAKLEVMIASLFRSGAVDREVVGVESRLVQLAMRIREKVKRAHLRYKF